LPAELGLVELSLGDPAAAHEVLGPVSSLVMALGVAEPATVPSVPDDIEALIALGDLGQAESQLAWLEERGRRLDRAWALATAGRCRALLLAARGDLDGAAAAVEAALRHHDRIALPVERGRTLLVKGGVERRRKHKAAAKQALQESLAIFETVGAVLWARRATSELSRVGLRPSAPLDLTATEAKVAELAASGLSTRTSSRAGVHEPPQRRRRPGPHLPQTRRHLPGRAGQHRGRPPFSHAAVLTTPVSSDSHR
jgi:tetratricopeptide (TPR) repeat protein